MINAKIKYLKERRRELEDELSLYDLDTTNEEERLEIKNIESQIKVIDEEIKDNKNYFKSLNKKELKEKVKNAKTEEEYIDAYREYNEYMAYTGKKSKIKTLVPIFGMTALIVGGSILGYNITRKPIKEEKETTESNVSNIDNKVNDNIKTTTGVSSEQISTMLDEEKESTTYSTVKDNKTTTSTNANNSSSSVVSTSTSTPTTSTRIIVNTTTTESKPITTERTEIIPETPTTEVPTTATTSTEATTTENTTEVVIYDTTEVPTTEDPYDPDMPIDEDEEDVTYYESKSKINILNRLKAELLNIKASKPSIAVQSVYKKILK